MMKKFQVGDLVTYSDSFQQWAGNVYPKPQVGLIIGYKLGADLVERPVVQWDRIEVGPVHPGNIKRVVD